MLKAVNNGGMSLSIGALTGNFLEPPFDLSITVTLNNLTITEGGETVSGDGDLSLSLGTTDGVSFTGSISGNPLVISMPGNSVTLINYQLTSTVSETTGAYTRAISGTVESSQLAGFVVFSTPVPFQGVGSNYPL